MNTDSPAAQPHIFHYTVDDEPQETAEHILTPNQIMEKAGVTTNDHYLVELVGNARKSYEGKPNEEIHMHEHQKFATQFTGVVPVS